MKGKICFAAKASNLLDWPIIVKNFKVCLAQVFYVAIVLISDGEYDVDFVNRYANGVRIR